MGSLVSLRWEDEECDPGSSLDRTATAVSLIGVDGESERSAFDGTFHVGYGIDSFAASELRSYLNPDASGEVTGRWVGGFDFAYLLIGQPARHGLWLYGGTVHGVRSADVNCEENPNLSFCKDELASADSGKEILYLVRNSTSLEAFVGLRGEFLTIGRRYGHAANLYLKGQAGFLTVANGGDDVVDLYHGAFGLIAIQGKLQDSYLEFGFGQSDLFFQNANDRWKIEGLLSWKLGDGGVYPFARLTLDSDFGSGADSVQTYIGVDIDLDQIYRTAARR